MANRKDLINAIAEECGTTKVEAKIISRLSAVQDTEEINEEEAKKELKQIEKEQAIEKELEKAEFEQARVETVATPIAPAETL